MRHIIALATLAVAPLVALTGYSTFLEYRRLATAVHTEALDHARMISAEHDRLLTGGQFFLMALSRLPEIRQKDTEACRRVLADLIADLQSYTAAAVYDLTGRPVCASSPIPDDSIANRDFFRQSLATGTFALGSAVRNRESGRLQLPAALPISGVDGRVTGVGVLVIDLDWISLMIAGIETISKPTVVIADRRGTVILRHPPLLEQIVRTLSLPPPLEEVLGATTPATVEGVGFDGVRRIWGYSPLAVTPKNLFVAAGLDKAAAFSRVHATMARSLAFSLIAFLLTLAIALLGAWMIDRRFPHILRPRD